MRATVLLHHLGHQLCSVLCRCCLNIALGTDRKNVFMLLETWHYGAQNIRLAGGRLLARATYVGCMRVLRVSASRARVSRIML